MDVYSSFIRYQNLEDALQFKWVDKPWYIHTIEYYSVLKTKQLPSHRKHRDGFPGGTMGKNSPANVGHMGLISGLARFHMLWRN